MQRTQVHKEETEISGGRGLPCYLRFLCALLCNWIERNYRSALAQAAASAANSSTTASLVSHEHMSR